MPLLSEFRIVMPVSVAEYEIAQRFTVAKASLAETGGGEGVEVIQNRAFANYPLMNGRYTQGQYTQKLYHLKSKVPTIIRMVAPAGSLVCLEESWNCYPYCKTVFTNPGYMKEDMEIVVETMHLGDRGNTENALLLSREELGERKVMHLDIADDSHLKTVDIKPETDPTQFTSRVTGRGPLQDNWISTVNPVMCCYKLVRIKFNMRMVGNKVENKLNSFYPRVFTKLNREAFCFIDNWHHMDKQQLLAFEAKVKAALDEARTKGTVRGMQENN